MKKIIKKVLSFVVLFMMIGAVGVSINVRAEDQVPIYRYCNNVNDFHFYTTNFTELGTGKYNYVYEGILGFVSEESVPGTVPLYRYCRRSNGAHFYTTDFTELRVGDSIYAYEGIQCYVAPAKRALMEEGIAKVYRYCRKSDDAHFYTTDFNELGFGNYIYLYEGVAFGVIK